MTIFTQYERARILGARAFQIAMNAPLLIKIAQEDLEKIKFDALKIAEIELNSDILPISIKKPLPERKDKILKRAKEPSPKKVEETETEEDKAGEIMELAKPEDEMDSPEQNSEEQ